jgi:hypothetical protein
MCYWSQAQEKVILIAGHTHRPVFKSKSHEEVIREALKEAEEKLAQKPDAALQQRVADLAAEWEWTHTRNQQTHAPAPLIEFKKPSYFNSDCCAFRDGDTTGLEFSDGEIRLVRWPDDGDAPRPVVLANAKLTDVFAAC